MVLRPLTRIVLEGLMETILIALGLTLAALYAWVIGGNDMANIIGTLIGGNVCRYKYAVILFAFTVLAGSLLQGYMVMKTMGKGIVPELDLAGAVSASVAAITWVFIATLLGMPISTSQSAVAGVLGVGLSRITLTRDWSQVNLGVLRNIVLSWVVSPLLALVVSMLLYIAFSKIFSKASKAENIVKLLALVFAGFDGYSFGANDVANAVGVYLAIAGTFEAVKLPGLTSAQVLALYGAVFIALGGAFMGKRVVETVGFRITRLDPVGALVQNLVSSTSVWLFTTIPYMLFGFGMPVSTTYIAVGSVIGIGIAKHRSFKGVNLKLVATILLSWVLTILVGALIAMSVYYAILGVIKGV